MCPQLTLEESSGPQALGASLTGWAGERSGMFKQFERVPPGDAYQRASLGEAVFDNAAMDPRPGCKLELSGGLSKKSWHLAPLGDILIPLDWGGTLAAGS